MKRLNWMTGAAVGGVLACGGWVMAQDKPDAQPPKDAPKAVTPSDEKKDEKPASKKMKFGDAAPALAIEKWIKGDAVTGFEKGKVYIVEIWTSWSDPCKEVMPQLTQMQKDLKSKGVTVIAVATSAWEKPVEQSGKSGEKAQTQLSIVEDAVKAAGETMGYTVAWDKDQGTNTAYMKASRQRGIPRVFVVDQKGNVAWYGHPDDLDLVIDDVVDGKWDYKDGPDKIAQMKDEAEKIREDSGGDPKDVLKAIAAFEAKYPKMAKEMIGGKYVLQMRAEMYTEAYKTGEKLVDIVIAKKNADELNTIAWGIVDPEGEIKAKDKMAGVPLAKRASAKSVELTDEKQGAYLDTLARCYWLEGNKAKAIELQKKAIAVLTKDQAAEMGAELEKTLRDYEGGKN